MYRRTMWIKRDGTKENVWRCINRLEYGKKNCHYSPSLKEPELHRAIMKCIQSMLQNRQEIVDTIKEAERELLLYDDAECNPELLFQRIREIDQEMANLLALVSQSDHPELWDSKFMELSEEKRVLQTQLDTISQQSASNQHRQQQLNTIFSSLDEIYADPDFTIDYSEELARRIIEQVTVLSKDKIEVRFVGGFVKEQEIIY